MAEVHPQRATVAPPSDQGYDLAPRMAPLSPTQATMHPERILGQRKEPRRQEATARERQPRSSQEHLHGVAVTSQGRPTKKVKSNAFFPRGKTLGRRG